MSYGDESPSADNHRKQFLARLGIRAGPGEETRGHVARSPPSVTLFLLDWDDTLFCTTAMRGYSKRPQNDQELLVLENACHNFLGLCRSLGETIIVTNAQEGWVQLCVDRFMPRLRNALSGVQVLSARDRFERSFPDDPTAWKCSMFAELKENSRQIANLVAIGDQEAEMKAVARLALLYHTSYVKSVRLIERPTVQQLRAQLQLLAEKLPRITHAARHMTISLQQKSHVSPPGGTGVMR